MKTQMNFSLRKIGLTIFASLFLVTVNMKLNAADPNAFLNGLEKFCDAQQQLLKYVAPSTLEIKDYEIAMEDINNLMDTNMLSLKYTAPETDYLISETEEVETLSTKLLESLKYKAPVEMETIETHEIDLLVADMDATLKYRAPVTANDLPSEFIPDYAVQMLAETIK